MMAEKTPIFAFDDVRVEPRAFKAWKNDEEVPLEPKTFHVLLFLIEHRGRLVEKNDLLGAVWKDTFVTENAMTREIAKLRKALGDDPKEPRYIQTVHTRGYRFIAEVNEVYREAEQIIEEERMTARSLAEPENANTPRQPVENAQASGTSAATEKKTAPLTVKALTPTTVVKSRVLRLPLALVLSLLVIGALVYLFVRNRDSARETDRHEKPVVVGTAQLTSWSGLDFYPAFSPDGNTISFSSDRTGSFEIYVKQLVAGAREVQLISDGGQNFQPAFSPDGSLIAYHSKTRGGIWVVPITGGTTRQLTEFGSRPAWSPDGSQIAFQSDPLTSLDFNARNAMPPSTIWIVSARGGEPKRLTQVGNPAGGHGAPAWSPDGKRIVFDASDVPSSVVWSVSVQGDDLKKISSGIDESDAVYAPDGKAIFFVDRASGSLMRLGSSIAKIAVSETGEPLGKPVKIFDTSGSRIRQISIAAKGKKIAYTALSTSGNIWAMPISPNNNEAAVSPVQLTKTRNTRNTSPAFSPDGKRIVYHTLSTGVASQIWLMNADGENQMPLTSGEDAYPCWFPDGNRIAFLSRREGPNGVWSVTIEGAKERKLFNFDEHVGYARMSPDGKRVAFNSKRSGTINVWTISIEGGQPRQLTFDQELAGFPAWSPNGRWIAFQLKGGEDTHVAVMPSDGGEPVQLTFDKGQSWIYDWSPDGDKIIFAGQRDGIWNVYWVSRSTKVQKQLTNFTRLNSHVRYPAWSPTGDRIAYEYAETNGNIWMIELE